MTVRECVEGIQEALWFLAGRIMEGVAMGFIIACLIGSTDTFLVTVHRDGVDSTNSSGNG